MPQQHKVGWALFLLSALLFGWAGVRSGDWVVVVASVVFGIGCVLFLITSS